jgi:hypothetical protein
MLRYKNVSAIARVSKRLNAAYNTALYGGNIWFLDISSPLHRYPKIELDQSSFRSAGIDEGCATHHPNAPVGYTTAWLSKHPTTPSAAAWPLSHRTAKYVRDLVISGAADHAVTAHDPFAQRVEREQKAALAAAVNVIVDTIVGTEDGEGDEDDSSHSLRRLVVQIGREAPSWVLTRTPQEVATNESEWRGPCLVLNSNSHSTGKSPYPLGKTVWEPFRRLKNVWKVELAGAISPRTAEKLVESMSEPNST